MVKILMIVHAMLLAVSIMAQQNTQNGYVLSPHGHLRVLLVFVEIVYPEGDKYPPGENSEWKSGQYPIWAETLFELYRGENPNAMVSRYYRESSFGNFQVSGDILIDPEYPDRPFQFASTGNITPGAIMKEAWEKGFTTLHSLPPDSFDLWEKGRAGELKQLKLDSTKLSFDHIMFIVRNSAYPNPYSGYSNPGDIRAGGVVFSDSHSVFSATNHSPIHILLHEFNHLLVGGNNMHCCGGNHSGSGAQMFLSYQGGWGMMGAANKSLLTCNAYDRFSLGWKSSSNNFSVSARDSSGNEIISDFCPDDSVFDVKLVLRDFLTFGDAVRIKIPNIPNDEFAQYLWVENHNTNTINGSPFDVFQYQDRDCIDDALPGLYMFLQVSHDQYAGKSVFGGYADFIKPLPASGMFDLHWGDTLVQNPWCVNNAISYPFIRNKKFTNPLSGNSVVEILPLDLNNDGFINEKEKRVQDIEMINDEYFYNLPYLGESEFAFRIDYNKGISIDGNPAAVNTLTLVNDDKDILKGGKPNNRVIYLNGVSVEIIAENYPNIGDVFIRVRNNNHSLKKDVRWCAPQIELPDMPAEYDLIIEPKVSLTLDFGQTPTRIDSATVFQGKNYFSSATCFKVLPGAKILMKKKSRILLRNNSILHIMPGAEILMEKGSNIFVRQGSRVVNEGKIRKLY